MADPAGEFSLRHQGTTYLKSGDGLDSYANFVGTATGFGSVFGTLKVTNPLSGPVATSGPCTWSSQAFLDDGTTVTGHGEGSYEQQAGDHRWQISMQIQISDGSSLRSEGEIDLTTLEFTGKISEA